MNVFYCAILQHEEMMLMYVLYACIYTCIYNLKYYLPHVPRCIIFELHSVVQRHIAIRTEQKIRKSSGFEKVSSVSDISNENNQQRLKV